MSSINRGRTILLIGGVYRTGKFCLAYSLVGYYNINVLKPDDITEAVKLLIISNRRGVI